MKVSPGKNVKVGQVTLFNYNYGSALQCYATQQIVRDLGYQCELIRQAPQNAFQSKSVYLLKAIGKIIRYPRYTGDFLRMMQSQRKTALSALTESDFQGLQGFIQEELCSIEYSYHELKILAHQDTHIAFLSGSDQIWNGSWFLRNKSFFLRFAPREKRIAWVPSFGTNTIAPYNIRRFQKDIGDYRCLSVREPSGITLIKELTGRVAVQLPDPVLQLSAETWRAAYQRAAAEVGDERSGGKYVFCYFLNEPGIGAMDFLEKRAQAGIFTIAFASNYECLKKVSGICFTGGSPWNYLSLLDGAAEVCSDSFHGLVFSLLFHKSMYIFRRQYTHSSDQSERIRALLEQFELSERFIEDRIPEGTMPDIPFEQIDGTLLSDSIRAKKYLEDALNHV